MGSSFRGVAQFRGIPTELNSTTVLFDAMLCREFMPVLQIILVCEIHFHYNQIHEKSGFNINEIELVKYNDVMHAQVKLVELLHIQTSSVRMLHVKQQPQS